MQIHQLKPKHKKKEKKRVGRGGKKGTYCGRVSSLKKEIAVVNVEVLDKKFKDGDLITPQVLIEKKIIKKIKGQIPPVKILGRGNLSKKLTIQNCFLSESARSKIEKAGGKIVQ